MADKFDQDRKRIAAVSRSMPVAYDKLIEPSGLSPEVVPVR